MTDAEKRRTVIRVLTCAANHADEGMISLSVDEVREIVELLREQEPKLVVQTTSTIRCPGCGKQITNRGAIHREIRYCWKCGQAVKWDG